MVIFAYHLDRPFNQICDIGPKVIHVIFRRHVYLLHCQLSVTSTPGSIRFTTGQPRAVFCWNIYSYLTVSWPYNTSSHEPYISVILVGRSSDSSVLPAHHSDPVCFSLVCAVRPIPCSPDLLIDIRSPKEQKIYAVVVVSDVLTTSECRSGHP